MYLAPGAVIASRYQIVRLLGRGGMGAVYLAKHIHTAERVALKVLLPQGGDAAQMIERFHREMRAPAKIRSDHVARVTDADVAPELAGAPFLVMELLDGCDLEKLLKSRGTLHGTEVAWIFSQIAATLDKAHSLGVIHRDLKPGNLFLHSDEKRQLIVKLLDFGIARMTEPDRFSIAEAKLTNTGVLLGTPTYMSPEQARSQSEQIGAASDIWSLGLIAFELLTGHSYWQAGSVAELIGQILFASMQAASTRAPHLPAGFDAWFTRSCARDPAQRWPSVLDQAQALAHALGLNVVPEERTAPPGELSAAIEALRYHARAGREDAHEEKPAAAQPGAGPELLAPETAFVLPSDTVRARPQMTTKRGQLLLAAVGSIVAVVVGMSRSARFPEPPRLPPPQPIRSPARVETAHLVPSAVPAPLPGPKAAPTVSSRKASHAATVPTVKMSRRPAPDKPQSVVPSAPSIGSVATASGYDPDGR